MPGVCKKILENFSTLGINFQNSDNIVTAFTHSSYSSDNYERLEFLGDSVLKLVMSKYLFDKYPDKKEGELTKLRSVLVSDKTLTEFSKKLGFQEFVRLGRGEKRSGKAMDTFLACVFEAVLGVIYLEFKNEALDISYNFIINNFQDEIEQLESEIGLSNPKAMLQEYAQSNFHVLPEYNLIKEEGLSHEKIFEVSVSLNEKTFKPAVGNSKKEAQKLAAANALVELNLIKKEEC